MANVFHQALAEKTGLVRHKKRIFEYRPSRVLENEAYKLNWDMVIITDKQMAHNRPYLVLFDKKEKTVTIMDVTVPADDNVSKAFTEKLTKYQDLAFELKAAYALRLFPPMD